MGPTDTAQDDINQGNNEFGAIGFGYNDDNNYTNNNN